MRRLLPLSLALGAVLVVASALSGCLITTHPRRSCGPAYHWNGARCVHNGKAYGHDKSHKSHKSHKSNRDHRH